MREDETHDELMTVGELARRTGLSIKAIRRYEAQGLIYSAGRSESGYRLFDESALWCAQVISTLRSLGLTIKEIDRLGSAYLSRPDEPTGPRLAALLDGAEERIDDRIAELAAVRGRIRHYRTRHAAALAGRPGADLFGSDPRRRRPAACLCPRGQAASSGQPHKEDRLMTTQYIDQTAALIRRVEGQELLPHAIRLLSDGEPVALEQLAAAAGWSVEDVEATLGAQTSAERDEQGRLVGLALTLRPTTHRFTVGGRTLFAWCATDTLMLPVILGRPALVESTCPQTGRPIRIELTPDRLGQVDPPDAVMSAVRPPGQVADVRSATCDHGHFFSSIAATAAWRDAHPDGHIYPVEEAFRLDRQVVKQMGWDRR